MVPNPQPPCPEGRTRELSARRTLLAYWYRYWKARSVLSDLYQAPKVAARRIAHMMLEVKRAITDAVTVKMVVPLILNPRVILYISH